MVRIVLCAVERGLADAWKRHCGGLDVVDVEHRSIHDVDCDALVSPANSFGFMDGGIDAQYLNRFGRSLQATLRSVIAEHHAGELVVGQADIVPTGAERPRWLVAAPTMRVPMILDETVNPYLAARAALLLVSRGMFAHGPHRGERIAAHVQTLAFPGMGTGVGRVPYDVCAHRMRAAIDEVLIHPAPFPDSWAEASERHQLLYTDRPRRLQFPKEPT